MTLFAREGQDASIEGMGKNLDGLINHLVDEIALTGDYGMLSKRFFFLPKIEFVSGQKKNNVKFMHLLALFKPLRDRTGKCFIVSSITSRARNWFLLLCSLLDESSVS